MTEDLTLLIVDDEEATRSGLRMALEDECDVYTAADPTSALTILKSENIDVMLTDLRMGTESGMDLLEAAGKLERPPISIMMTAYGSVDTAVEAMRRGAWHFVTKPLNLDEVELLVKRAFHSKKVEAKAETLETEVKQLKRQVSDKFKLDRMIGRSLAMKQVFELVEQVAPTRATVLIEGESGTGKELVAHALHHLSGRPAGKIVVVNCAALSPQLLESELFGHEKGAFTGASQRRIGRFEQADGGTLVLDEIGEIDPTTQVKLLRVLSERTVERVGSNAAIKVDVRLVAATNKDLKKLVEEGDFREDLFFRLNVVRLEMPPLRARREDIVLLANAFLKEFAEENGRPIKPLDDHSLKLLSDYSWPGNVRELRTAIEHGVVMSNADTIQPKHLPAFLSDPAGSITVHSTKITQIESTEPKKTLDGADEFNLHEIERATIERALAFSQGNRTKAATLLGISRRTLQRKLKEIDID